MPIDSPAPTKGSGGGGVSGVRRGGLGGGIKPQGGGASLEYLLLHLGTAAPRGWGLTRKTNLAPGGGDAPPQVHPAPPPPASNAREN